MGEYINRALLISSNKLRSNNNLAGQLFLFFIWPFGALLQSLRNIKSKNFLIIYSLFCILLCWNLDVVTKAYDDLSGIAYFFMHTDSSTDTFFQRVHAYVTFSPDAPREIYLYFMMWFSRLFSDNPHFFFALCALPYLFFQTKCFKMFLEDDNFRNGLIGILVIFLFMFPRDIITIQNPRFVTGLWLCIYVIMKSFHPATKGNKHLFWLLLAPTIHSSYWFLAPVMLLCVFVGRSVRQPGWLIALVYISIPFSYMSSDIISNNVGILSLLPFSDSLGAWAVGYASSTVESTQVSGSGFYWIPVLFGILKKTAYLIVPIMIIQKRDIINKQTTTSRLVSCYLFLFAIANFVQSMPVLGVRFFLFVQILTIYVLFRVQGFNTKLYYIILVALTWDVFSRYFFGGAVSRVVPLILFYTPLPYIIFKYWGKTTMDVVTPEFNIEDYL